MINWGCFYIPLSFLLWIKIYWAYIFIPCVLYNYFSSKRKKLSLEPRPNHGQIYSTSAAFDRVARLLKHFLYKWKASSWRTFSDPIISFCRPFCVSSIKDRGRCCVMVFRKKILGEIKGKLCCTFLYVEDEEPILLFRFCLHYGSVLGKYICAIALCK